MRASREWLLCFDDIQCERYDALIERDACRCGTASAPARL